MEIFKKAPKNFQAPIGDLFRGPDSTKEQDPQYANPAAMMGGGLPGISTYGTPKPQFNEAMLDRMLDTCVPVVKNEKGEIQPRMKLWLLQSDVFRHFQLTNLRSRAQTEIERDIMDILMLANQDGNDELCKELQQLVYAKIAMFKSRSDLPVQLRERDAWITNVNEIKTQEIKRPEGSGGFFSDLIHRRRSYDD